MTWLFVIIAIILVIVLIWAIGEPRRRAIEEGKAAEEAERKRKEAERQARINELLRSGDIISHPGKAEVMCGNGHHYRYDDFGWETVRTGYEDVPVADDYSKEGWHYEQQAYDASEWHFGCPFCKSSTWHFVDASLRGKYKKCSSSYSCKYWYLKNKYEECPVCKA